MVLALIKRHWGVFALAVAGVAILAAVLAPSTVGRFVGDLWVTTMSALIQLLQGFFAH